MTNPAHAAGQSTVAATAAVAVDTQGIAAAPPPLAHAIGGSLGSALALLLFYPLERARIELQASAANAASPPTLPVTAAVRPSLLPETTTRASMTRTPSKVRRRHEQQLHYPRPFFLGEETSSSSSAIMPLPSSPTSPSPFHPTLATSPNSCSSSTSSSNSSNHHHHSPSTVAAAATSAWASTTTARGGNATGVLATTAPLASSPSPSCLLNDAWMMQQDPLQVVISIPSSASPSSSLQQEQQHDNDHIYNQNDNDFVDHVDFMVFPEEMREQSKTAGQRRQQRSVINNEKALATPISETSPTSAVTTTTTACLIRLWQRNELYRGVGPLVLTMAVSNFIFFYLNALCKDMLVPLMSKTTTTTSAMSSSSYLSLLASCLAGVINVLLTNPLWVANLRIVTGQQQPEDDGADDDVLRDQLKSTALAQSSSSLSVATNHLGPTSSPSPSRQVKSTSAVTKLWREMIFLATTRGWMHLWQGTGTSILLVSNPVIQFFSYEQFKLARIRQFNSKNSSIMSSWRMLLLQLLLRRQGHRQARSPSVGAGSAAARLASKTSLTVVEAFLVGAIAKAIATVVTYPLQLAQSVLRLQQQEENDSSNNNNHDHDDDIEMKQSTSASSPLDKSKSPSSSLQMSPYRGTWDCLWRLYQRDGLPGLFTGMPAKLLQTVLTAAFTFLTYEQILRAAASALSLLDVKQSQSRKQKAAAAVPPSRL